MKFLVRRWRRVLLIAVIAVSAMIAYDLAVLSSTAAKVLNHGRAFDWWRGPVSRSTTNIGSISADVYVGSRSRRPLLFVHGVNESGKDSADLQRVAEALAGSGFRVVVPDFARMRRQNVTPADIDDVELVARSLGEDIGIVCASYGCGPSLIAAARPGLRNRIQFIVTFGAYFDLKETLALIITGPQSKWSYSKWLYLSANADLITDDHDRRELLKIGSERQNAPNEIWITHRGGIGPEALALLDVFESKTVAEFDGRIERVPALRERFEKLSPSNYVPGLRARLIIMHLLSDPAIPSSQSLRLAAAARTNNLSYRLTILNAYGHTRPDWPPGGVRNFFGFYLPESWKFLRMLREVLSYS
jgi:pimeloyl-ACP methyl ester carboxylesterase